MKTYKCLAKNCNYQLEPNYLFCSIECSVYGKYNLWLFGRNDPKWLWRMKLFFQRNIYQPIYYHFVMLWRKINV